MQQVAGNVTLSPGATVKTITNDAQQPVTAKATGASTELDGLPTERSTAPLGEPAPVHPNGVTGIDHVVAFSPDLDRTTAALQAAGLDLRRIRELFGDFPLP